MAEELGIAWRTIQHWEKHTAPKRSRLEAVARLLNTSVEYLLFGTGEPDGSNNLSAKALEVARLYDALPPAKQRLLYAQAQVLHNPDSLTWGDSEPPAVEPKRAPRARQGTRGA